jgi:hypothetical protein
VNGCGKRIFALLAIALLGVQVSACSQHTALGELAIPGGGPVKFSAQPGAKFVWVGEGAVSFAKQPGWFRRFKFTSNASTVFDLPLSASNYAANTLSISHVDSGLLYDIQARWGKTGSIYYPRSDVESCEGYGHCRKTVTRSSCENSQSSYQSDYEPGEHRYQKKRDSNDETGDCKPVTETQTGNFSDCPGTRQVENTYQTFRYQLTVEFLSAHAPGEIVAVFTGDSEQVHQLSSRGVAGECSVY